MAGVNGGENAMNRVPFLIMLVLLASYGVQSFGADDPRQHVQIPEPMERHMLSNMRDHLAAINEVLVNMADGKLEEAAAIAEFRLGMSSLESHGASHLAGFMPEEMRQMGTAMHRAASRFALRAQEGEPLPAYRALGDITSACVACHSNFRTR